MTADPAVGWPVTSVDRAGLLRKYELLAMWRRARDAEGGGDGDGDCVEGGGDGGGDGGDGSDREPEVSPGRAALQALAREFPGALRELDVLGLSELRRRVAVLRGPAATGSEGLGDAEHWVSWILAYHGTMRAALLAKRAAGRARRIPADTLAKLAVEATAAAGVPIDVAFLRAAANPPGGRLTMLVLCALGQRFDVPATRIASTLFPPRRPSPYRLPT